MFSVTQRDPNHPNREKTEARREPGSGLGFAARLATVALTRLLFYGVVTPIGLALRLAGRDPLRRRRDLAAPSYWTERRPPGPPPTSMKHQV